MQDPDTSHITGKEPFFAEPPETPPEAHVKAHEAFFDLTPISYPVTAADEERIERTFQYHPPNEDQAKRYVILRDQARALAYTILRAVPPSRERSLALTKLEEVIMHANAGIARNEV